MVLAGVIALVACLVGARRLQPPEREAPAPLLAGLAGASMLAFATAGLGLMVASAPLAGFALLATGALAGLYLWLLRGGEDDDDGDGRPGSPDVPEDAEWARFSRKSLRRRPRVPR